jgi:PleD family two-component response regulator
MATKVIICVDDDSCILTSLGEQLKRNFGADYEIELASSAIEAIDLCGELIADEMEIPLIISDRNLGEMSGDKLLIELHSLYPQTLKILLTGQTDVDSIINIVNAGALYRYLTKPWDETDLVLTVREALRSYDRDRQLAAQHELLIETNQQLEESLSLLVATLEATADGILVLDDRGKVIRYNQKFTDLWAISEATEIELDKHNVLSIAQAQLVNPETSIFSDRQSQFNSNYSAILELKNGKILECYCQIQQLQHSKQFSISHQFSRVWSFRDVTQRQKTEAIVNHQAFHDILTDLPNRALFDRYLSEALINVDRTQECLAVMFLDLDRLALQTLRGIM